MKRLAKQELCNGFVLDVEETKARILAVDKVRVGRDGRASVQGAFARALRLRKAFDGRTSLHMRAGKRMYRESEGGDPPWMRSTYVVRLRREPRPRNTEARAPRAPMSGARLDAALVLKPGQRGRRVHRGSGSRYPMVTRSR